MSRKRLNPHRRLLANQSQVLKEALDTFGRAHDDSSKLQQGKVKSALAPTVHLTAYATPRDNWEGQGRKARIVDGKVKLTKPNASKPFQADGKIKPLAVPSIDGPVMLDKFSRKV